MSIKFFRKTFPVFLLGLFSTAIFAQLHYEDFAYNGSGGGALMEQASALAVSPDGNYVYVASSSSNAINVFSKNGASPSGELTFVEVVKTGLDGVLGLTAAQSVAVSPDGNNVYAVGTSDDALVTFGRSQVNGKLVFQGMQKDGLGGVDGLNAPFMVKVSPDGKHVYASATDDRAISVFERDATTGNLTFASSFSDPLLNTVLGFDISPDGKNLYVAGHAEAKLLVYARDVITGGLTFVEALEDNQNFVDGLGGVFAVFVSPDGKNVYATGVYDNALAIFSRDESTGSLTYMTVQEDGQAGVDYMNFPFHLTGSDDGNFVYAIAANDNALNVFQRNPDNGDLTFLEVLREGNDGVENMNFPVHMAVSPDGKFVYAAANGTGSAVVFAKQASGSLTFTESQMTGTDGVSGLRRPYGVTVSPDGNHVYAASYDDDGLAIFSRSNSTGDLSYVSKVVNGENGVDGLDRAYSVSVSPDGNHVYAVAQNDDALVAFTRDVVTGELTFVEKIKDGQGGVDGLNGARFVTQSPDGNNVYVAAYYDDAITVFNRNKVTGKLTFSAMMKNKEDGVSGLNGAISVTISADGTHAYAASYSDDAVVAFSRNTTNGRLTFLEKYENGENNISGLNGANSVLVSNDGKNVYACGYNDNTVVTFNRDATTGLLTLVEIHQDGIDGVDGLKGARSIALNPDGFHFYAVSGGENAIALFERDATTGALTYQTKHEDGMDGVDGLAGSRSVAVSPYGRHIYVAGADDDAIAIFSCTYEENMVEEICEGGSITIGNNVYTEAGIYQDVVEETYGCRSQVTLELSVLITSEAFVETICAGEEFELGDQVYTESGMYQSTVMNALGCEVNTSLELTVTPAYETTSAVKICEGENYIVGNNTFTESGIYQNTLTSMTGCDSIIVVELTVNPTAFAEQATICSGTVYSFGTQTLTTSGTYQEIFSNGNNCDSVVTLELEIVDGYSEIITHTMCAGGSYTLGEETYTTAGFYTNNLVATTGCDSTIALNLLVEENISVLMNKTICSGEVYNFAGVDYDSTGIYSTQTITNTGCDSTTTLYLNVLADVPSELNEVICAGETYYFGNNQYTSSGTYTSIFSNPNGCEKMVTLNLKVKESVGANMEQTICKGEEYNFGSQKLSQSGTYFEIFNTPSGCDSVVMLNLTVTPTIKKTFQETICKNETYTVGNKVFYQSGTYEIMLQSAQTGCDSLVTLNLIVVEIEGTSSVTSDDGTGTGSINLSVSSGTPPYDFEWSNGEDTQNVSGLTAGSFFVIVSDASGCSKAFTFEIENTTSLKNEAVSTTFDAMIYPNPTSVNGLLQISLTNDEPQDFDFKLFDTLGRLVSQQRTHVGLGKAIFPIEVPKNVGIYYLQVTNEKQESRSMKVMVR